MRSTARQGLSWHVNNIGVLPLPLKERRWERCICLGVEFKYQNCSPELQTPPLRYLRLNMQMIVNKGVDPTPKFLTHYWYLTGLLSQTTAQTNL